MKYDKNQALKIIVSTAKNYEQKMKDKHFLILFQKAKEIESVQVGFRSNHFLHMTGVETKLTAQQFYERCVEGKLSAVDFEPDKQGKSQRKLAVLQYVPELLYNPCMIGDFIGSGVYIRAEYFVGNAKSILSMGFRSGKTVDMPVTLYNEDVRRLVNPVCKVLAIYSKPFDAQKYIECTYLSKGVDTNKLSLM